MPTEPFEYPPSAPFIDPDGLPQLSPAQARHFARWARPAEIAAAAAARGAPFIVGPAGPCARAVVQELVTDCSFISSLCIAGEVRVWWGRGPVGSRERWQGGSRQGRAAQPHATEPLARRVALRRGRGSAGSRER